jgi:hypothetical protein
VLLNDFECPSARRAEAMDATGALDEAFGQAVVESVLWTSSVI